MKINKRGYWENEDLYGHIHDSKLCDSIISYLKKNHIKNVVDFGCGPGEYSKKIITAGMECEAYDGNPNTVELTSGLGKIIDLSEFFYLGKEFDCVMSLEVGEHIPAEYEDIFINNLCRHTQGILILSWAIVGQGGDGHVNCRDNQYIIEKMESLGMLYDSRDSLILRESVSNAWWFKETLMVFKKINNPK